LRKRARHLVHSWLAARGLVLRPLQERARGDARWGINVLELTLERWFAQRGTQGLVLLQVGANDGIEEDPLYTLLQRHPIHAYLCEPLPDVFRRLAANHAARPHVRPVQCAVASSSGPQTLYRLRDAGASRNLDLVAGLDRARVERFRRLWQLPESALVTETVDGWRLADLLQHLGLPGADILVVSAEGFDPEICLQALDLPQPPEVLHFQYTGSPLRTLSTLLARLEASGYVFARSGLDVTAVRGGLIEATLTGQPSLTNSALA
jgi:FkbM family methyltransferase